MPRRKGRRGIVGIEAAIILIAFVIVAAALAFVALNMGLFTSQKSKEVMARGLGESSTALEVDGSVTGNVTNSKVDAIVIPLKVAPGREAVDLNKTKTTVRLIAGTNSYEDVYLGVDTKISQYDLSSLLNSTLVTSKPAAYTVFVIGDGDSVLEYGEKAVLVVQLNTALGPYESIQVEIRPPEGAPLTIERMIPASLPTDGAVDLG